MDKKFSRIFNSKLLLPTALFAIPVLFIIILKIDASFSVPRWDECLCAYDTQRLLSGQIPYRDFFNFIPPGTFFLQAAWYLVWGGKATLTLGRALSAFAAFLSWILISRTLIRSGWKPIASMTLASFYPIALYSFWPIPSHHWFADIPFFLSFEAYNFENSSVRGSKGWLWIGSMSMLSTIFLQTTGFVSAVFWGITLLLGERRKLEGTFSAILGGGLVSAPLAIWLLINGALGGFVQDTIVWPFQNYGSPGGPNAVNLLGDLPSRILSLWNFPTGYSILTCSIFSAAGTCVYVGIITIILFTLYLSVSTLVKAIISGAFSGTLRTAAMLITIISLTLYLRGKTDWLHLVFLVGVIGLVWCLTVPKAKIEAKRIVVLVVLIGILSGASTLWQAGFLAFNSINPDNFTDVDRSVRDAPVNVYLRSRPWLKTDDRIVALPEGGQVYLYVRPSAIGYTLLTPLSEHYNTLEDHRIAAEEILKNKPRCIIMTSDLEKDYLDKRSPVGRIISGDFRRLTRIEDAVIYIRKDPE